MQGHAQYVTSLPVSNDQASFMITLRGRATFLGSTATSCIAQLVGLCGATGTNEQSFVISYGVDMADVSLTATAIAEHFDSSNPFAMIGATNGDFRVLAMGLRVHGSGIDTESGNIEGGCSKRLLRTAAATWAGNIMLDNCYDGTVYPLKDGCTVRKAIAPVSEQIFQAPPANNFATSGLSTWQAVPTIRVTGMSATTVLTFEWIYYVEIQPDISVPVSRTFSTNEPEIDEIINLISLLPLTSKAGTFPSFLKSVWGAISQVGKYVWNRGLRKTVDRSVDSLISKIDTAIAF
jgi:hypothetical protein